MDIRAWTKLSIPDSRIRCDQKVAELWCFGGGKYYTFRGGKRIDNLFKFLH